MSEERGMCCYQMQMGKWALGWVTMNFYSQLRCACESLTHTCLQQPMDTPVAMASYRYQPWELPFESGTCANGVFQDWIWCLQAQWSITRNWANLLWHMLNEMKTKLKSLMYTYYPKIFERYKNFELESWTRMHSSRMCTDHCSGCH